MDNNTVNFSRELQDLVLQSEERAKQFTSDKLKTNQIRNFYSAITRLRTEFEQEPLGEDGQKSKQFGESIETQLVMLKPKLAYAAGRQTAVRANFYPFMKSAIDGVLESKRDSETLKKYFALIESVVAYHKFYGGD